MYTNKRQYNCNTCGQDPYYVLREGKKSGCEQANCQDQRMPKAYYDPSLYMTCNPPPLLPPPGAPKRFVTMWDKNYLVSNRDNLASHQDPLLINPWGITIVDNQLWVVVNTSDVIINYNLFGGRVLGPISLRDAYQNSTHPTGIAVNCGGGFSVTNGNTTRAAKFIIVNEQGVVDAYNPMVSPQRGFVVLNMQITGRISVFKGVTIANNNLYIANFFQRQIDVFDGTYNRLPGFLFVDGDTSDPIPMDYAPHNIVNIGCYLYVLWAKKDPNVTLAPLYGPGHGYISVFNYDGSFVKRFTSRGVLDTPWAMIPAPCNCGIPPGAFLVGNTGNGRINIFDCNGGFIAPMLGQNGLPITIEGLRGLAPHYAELNEIYYTASPENLIDGYVGSLSPGQTYSF